MNRPVSPYQRFSEALQSPSKRQNYTIWFNQFCEYGKADADKLASLTPEEIADLIFQYIVHLKMRAEKGEISPNSVRPMIAPIKLFCVQNDIIVNFKRLANIMPRPVAPKNQGAYSDEDVKKLLSHTTSKRNKAIMHFLASTGARIEVIHLLNFGDIEPLEDGAMVWVYQDDIERYRVFLTPEAYNTLKDYLKLRELNGCSPTKSEDPVFCKRNHRDRMSYGGARQIIPNIMVISGIRSKKAERKISSKSPNHAFRKRYENILINCDIPSKYIETLCGSYETGRDKHYVRNTVTNEQLWNQFKKAIPALMIDKNEKQKREIQTQKIIIDEYENKLNQKVAEIEGEYQNQIDKHAGLIEEFGIMLWHQQMKNYFRDQLEGKGHPHTNKAYREWMRGFVDTKNVSEMLKFMKVTGEGTEELIKRFENIEKFYRD